MLRYVLVVALGYLVSGSPAPNIQPRYPWTGRIVGGENVSIQEIPYQVSIQIHNVFICGGSLISDNIVLTAAHCLEYPPSSYTIRAGSNSSESGGTVHKVKDVIQHEGFDYAPAGQPLNDIGLIRLAEPMKIDATHRPIALFNKAEESRPNASAVVTGYGKMADGNLPIMAQTVTVSVVGKSECNAYYASFGGISKNQICAAVPQGGKDSCQGDSGGPLTIGSRQAGVVSWGLGCGVKGYPGVYTEVAAYRDWIAKNGGI